MRIETDLKLDFEDVLIRPKRSTLSSREEVNLNRNFLTKFSRKSIDGIPIIAANMDTIGTFAMAKSLASHHMFTALHKHYSVDELVEFYDTNAGLSLYTFYTVGTSTHDFVKFSEVNTKLINRLGYSPIYNLCLDVANGYTEYFAGTIKKYREHYPDLTIMAGNVVTAEMTEELILEGADLIKIGVGPGCFAAGSLVLTKNGLKPINEVLIGDEVKTHKNRWRKVKKTFNYREDKSLISINGIKSTKSHEYYVLHKKYKDIVTDTNIHEYATWISAELLTKEYLLLKIKDKY